MEISHEDSLNSSHTINHFNTNGTSQFTKDLDQNHFLFVLLFTVLFVVLFYNLYCLLRCLMNFKLRQICNQNSNEEENEVRWKPNIKLGVELHYGSEEKLL